MTHPLSSFTPSDFWQAAPSSRLHALARRACHTRVAPSPTGFMHLGTLRTALHNFLLSKHSGGKFLLRIDDTDTARNLDGARNLITDMLRDYQLTPNLSFAQSGRLDHYRDVARMLVGRRVAISLDGAIALPLHGQAVTFFDVASGVVTIPCPNKPLILLRSDGMPTYHFASVLDDIDFGINTVVRGQDHLMNTQKHIVLAQALKDAGYDQAAHFLDHIVFAHVGLILMHQKKLSKRDDAADLAQYAHLPCMSVLHWALMLGWGHPDPHFDKNYPVLDSSFGVFLDGKLRASNMDIHLQRLQFLAKAYR